MKIDEISGLIGFANCLYLRCGPNAFWNSSSEKPSCGESTSRADLPVSFSWLVDNLVFWGALPPYAICWRRNPMIGTGTMATNASMGSLHERKYLQAQQEFVGNER